MVVKKFDDEDILLIDDSKIKIYAKLQFLDDSIITKISSEESDGGDEVYDYHYMSAFGGNRMVKRSKKNPKKIFYLSVKLKDYIDYYVYDNKPLTITFKNNDLIGGVIHNTFGPAIIMKHKKFFVKNSKVSNLFGPAIISDNGDCIYSINGILHRDDGPAFINKHNSFDAFITYIDEKECHITECYMNSGNCYRENCLPATIWSNNLILEFYEKGIFKYALLGGGKINNEEDFKNEIIKRRER